MQGLGVTIGEIRRHRKVLDNYGGYSNAGYANCRDGVVWCVNYEH